MLFEFNEFAWLTGVTILVVFLILLRQRGRYYLFFFSIFWIYLLALVSVTLFPIPLGTNDGSGFKTIGDQFNFMFKYGGLNLVPLYFNNCWDLPLACATEIYENILLTVPFGFGISFIVRLKKRDFIRLALALGLVIEATQFALDLILGGVYRSVDINDVLFNALGMLAGYGLFSGFVWLFMVITSRFKIRYSGLLAYIQEIIIEAGFTEIDRPIWASSRTELDK